MLEEQVVVDKIEVMEDGCVQVRTANRVLRDGEVIASEYHRHTLNPGDDYSGEDEKVQAICVLVHTEEVVAAFALKAAAQGSEVEGAEEVVPA